MTRFDAIQCNPALGPSPSDLPTPTRARGSSAACAAQQMPPIPQEATLGHSSTLGASIRSSFLPITGHVGNARVMHCAAAIEQVRRTFRALPLCAWLHIETDNGPRSFRVPGIPMRGHQHSRLCDILGIAPIAEHGLTVNDGAWSFYLE